MSSLSQLQQGFLDLLLGKNEDFAAEIVNQGAIDARQRLSIYRNAYHIRLRDALETDHEMLGRYLGDDLFEQMVQGYIRDYPSRYQSLRDFGAELPTFLRETRPFAEHPVLAEIAAFERLLMDVFDAREAERIDRPALEQLPADDWPAMTLRLHPGVQLYSPQWNSVAIWRAMKAQEAPPELAPLAAGGWLMWRSPERLSEFRFIHAEELAALKIMLHGGDFSSLCEELALSHGEDQASAVALELLLRWLDQGLIIKLNA